jgi:(E)-4-hydroxy-3-methyl-but-2-enyl pyrophosphate reductase
LFKEANERGISVVDATCPFVRLEQELAVELKKEGYTVVVVGDRDHAEVRAVTEWLDDEAWVVSPTQVMELPWKKLGNRIGVVSQTTQSIEGLNRVVASILPHCREIKVHNTICSATVQRQEEVRELARQAQVLVVIGGRDSANTRRLAEIGQEQGVETYLVESSEELRTEWFDHISTVAVTAGASTPMDQINEVVRWIECL